MFFCFEFKILSQIQILNSFFKSCNCLYNFSQGQAVCQASLCQISGYSFFTISGFCIHLSDIQTHHLKKSCFSLKLIEYFFSKNLINFFKDSICETEAFFD
jgi:hypothetical protein